MKKPRKPKPKAKPQRPARPAVAPRQARASARPPARRDGGWGRTLAATLAAWTGSGRSGALRRRPGRNDAIAALRRAVAAPRIRPPWRGSAPAARAASYSHDEREAFALLILPFLLVVSAIVIHQSVRTLQTYIAVIAAPDAEVAALPTRMVSRLPASRPPPPIAAESQPEIALLPSPAGPPETVAPSAERPEAVRALPPHDGAPIDAPPAERLAATPATPLAAARPAPAPAAAPAAGPDVQVALLAPAPSLDLSPAPSRSPTIESTEADEHGNPLAHGICTLDHPERVAAATPVKLVSEPPLDRDTFGLYLAKAAETQTGAFVVYNDAYRRIAYPMGDVPSFFGVCTDVIVRAYRALGIDLQALVHKARSGRGDPNIDHRRTEVLRRFFTTHGESLPVTSFPENYRPGDIVTYHRPQNQRSRAHIAIVSSVMAPSGRPMIVHNRGWGPQLEDALFVDQITGHYRYAGPPPSQQAARVETPEPARHGPRTLSGALVPASFPAAGTSASAE